MVKNNMVLNIVAWQEGITPNLLSGFYEQFFINEGNESMRAIMQGLREDFEKQTREGFVEGQRSEIKRLLNSYDDGKIRKTINISVYLLENRLKELK